MPEKSDKTCGNESKLMRRDITYIQGVELEEATEIIRHCFFRDDQVALFENKVYNRDDFVELYLNLIDYWKYERCLAELFEKTGKKSFYYYGKCEVCNSAQPFIVDYQAVEIENGIKMPNWRERLICPNCWCNSRQRYLIHCLFDAYKNGMNVLVYEKGTNFFQRIAREIPEAKSVNCDNESIKQGIFKSNFSSESFDLIVSNDSFQKIDDYERVFDETWRILRAGGKLIFSVPFNANSDFSKQMGDITIFGWDLLDSLKKYGFVDVYSKVYYSLKDGYLGYLPMCFEAIK